MKICTYFFHGGIIGTSFLTLFRDQQQAVQCAVWSVKWASGAWRRVWHFPGGLLADSSKHSACCCSFVIIACRCSHNTEHNIINLKATRSSKIFSGSSRRWFSSEVATVVLMSRRRFAFALHPLEEVTHLLFEIKVLEVIDDWWDDWWCMDDNLAVE